MSYRQTPLLPEVRRLSRPLLVITVRDKPRLVELTLFFVAEQQMLGDVYEIVSAARGFLPSNRRHISEAPSLHHVESFLQNLIRNPEPEMCASFGHIANRHGFNLVNRH